jgi:hypothetical protein
MPHNILFEKDVGLIGRQKTAFQLFGTPFIFSKHFSCNLLHHKALKTTLQAEIDRQAWESLHGHSS